MRRRHQWRQPRRRWVVRSASTLAGSVRVSEEELSRACDVAPSAARSFDKSSTVLEALTGRADLSGSGHVAEKSARLARAAQSANGRERSALPHLRRLDFLGYVEGTMELLLVGRALKGLRPGPSAGADEDSQPS